MPKRTKKLLVYLDQNFVSELAKADINNRVKREWKDLYQLLKEGFLDEKLVVPQSWFHTIETSLAPALKKRIVSYQNYLGQVSLQNAEHVRNFQTGRFLQRFLGRIDEDPFETEIAFREPPDKRVERFNITVDLNLAQWEISSGRDATAVGLEAIRAECVVKRIRYEDQLEIELNAQREFFLRNALYYAHLCEDPVRNLIAFSMDPIFRTIPVLCIPARLWSRIFTQCPTRKIKTGDATDIDVLSTYLPYMDVIGTDAFMATQLSALGIDKEHEVRLFSAKTASLQLFCEFLRDYLKNTLPVNRPTISVFVLPSQSVKDNAFNLFFELGAAARLLGTKEYAEIYGFDDGKMPRYELPQMPGREIPFYGLQDVNPIKLEPGTTLVRILDICRERCKSDHFLLIDQYRAIKNTFLVGAAMSAESDIQTSDGYRIFAKQA